MLKYFLHEVEEAAAKLSAYVADPTLTIQIDDDRGRLFHFYEPSCFYAHFGATHPCGIAAVHAARRVNPLITRRWG